MTSRYENRIVLRNQEEQYKELFENRNVPFIRHYNTPVLGHPTDEDIDSLVIKQHLWSIGDRYYKLADKYYNLSKYWWIIAWYNQAPTEAHLMPGDVIYIPLPLERVLSTYGY
tara:strand:- start:97 stop:435 length:339 start_codon:yes stop_codon:yes gene_type:complete